MKNAYLSLTMVLVACGGASMASSAEPATASSAENATEAPEASPASSACEQLATTCHGNDEGNALVTECHILGHDADAAACGARYEECMTACKQAAATHAH